MFLGSIVSSTRGRSVCVSGGEGNVFPGLKSLHVVVSAFLYCYEYLK